MKLVKPRVMSRILEYLIVGMMVLDGILVATLYWTITDITGRVAGESGRLFEKYFVVLAVSGLIAELILWQARKIMRNIRRGRAFSQGTVHHLSVIAWECLCLSGFYVLMSFFVHKFFMVAVFAAFALMGLLLLVLAALFADAIQYKRENDMTI